MRGLTLCTFLVTMDVRTLYTDIDHDKGTEACIEKLDTRKEDFYSIVNNTFADSFGPKIERISIW